MGSIMEKNLNKKELFVNIRKSIRLLYEYQKRMQGTMFHIKSFLNLPPSGRIKVNKLFSYKPRTSNKDYGETILSKENWAWDYLYPMAMEYYIGEKKIGEYEFRLSVIQVTDDGYYKAKLQGRSIDILDTYTFSSTEESDTIVLFVMEMKKSGTEWDERWRWDRDKKIKNLEKLLIEPKTVIDDKTAFGNHFVVMKFSIYELLSEASIKNVINKINNHIYELTKNKIN